MYVFVIKLGLGRLPPSSDPATLPVPGGPLGGGGWGPPWVGADASWASWSGWRWLMVAVDVLDTFFSFFCHFFGVNSGFLGLIRTKHVALGLIEFFIIR